MMLSSVVHRRRSPTILAVALLFTASIASIPTASANEPPTIAGQPAATAIVDAPYTFQPSASDPEGKKLRFSIANKPAWAKFSNTNGRLSGAPSAAYAGEYGNVSIRVSDGRNIASLPPFSISVKASANSAPTISGAPATAVTAGQSYTFIPSASDEDGDALSFSITNKPAWATFSTSTGQLSGTPTAANVGSYANIVISASDGKATTSLPAFSITVNAAPNTVPVISGAPATSVTAGGAYSFQPSASDADGDALTFSVANKPTWATFSASTGRLSGTPAATNVGSYANIVISASDGKATTSLPAFSITVNAAPNTAPVINGSPATSVTAGSAYSFQPSVSDAEGDTLAFSITNKPTWATFSTVTGLLSGTPGSAHVGSYPSIVISVSDGKATTSLAAFSITVNAAPNTAPVISGSPATSVNAGVAYSFRPSASDANGDPLTFSITNKPTWATFDAATGQLSGTPTAAQVGTYSNIVISVSDSKASAALPAFSIAVTQVSVGAATLSWTPPTQNTDGSALTNLAGYRLYYGLSAGSLNQTIEIANPGVTTYVIENLSPGTYFFAVRAYSSAGGESVNSNVASKVVQ
jgi:hypothetical protein